MARAIDSEVAFRFLTEQLVKETGAFSKGVNKGLNIARSAIRNPDAISTLTPQNEPLTLEQLRSYRVETDLASWHPEICDRAADCITDLMARCDRLEEARENANEACAKWEALCHMAEQERDQYKAALQNWHEEG